MAQNSNIEVYPNIVFPPTDITVDNERYKYYLLKFDNLYSLHDYLKSKPYINRKIFSRLSSRSSDNSFYGLPYDEAVDDLIDFSEQQYFEFAELIENLVNIRRGETQEYRTIRTAAGGHINNHLYSVGAPLCYETEERIKTPKYVSVYSAISYTVKTKKEQLFNRAIILISIVNALEKRGYNVDLNAFEMSTCEDEMVNIIVDLKGQNSKINFPALYKASFKVEFLRRILFGVLETACVEKPWGVDYGQTCKENLARKVLHIKDEDLYFGSPQELGVEGKNLEDDFKNSLRRLHIEDLFDVKLIDSEFQKQLKKIKL